MSSTKEEIEVWIERAKEKGATHLVIVLDTLSYYDYPVYVMPEEKVQKVVTKYSNKRMQRINEVYSLTGKHKVEDQLEEKRARHLD